MEKNPHAQARVIISALVALEFVGIVFAGFAGVLPLQG